MKRTKTEKKSPAKASKRNIVAKPKAKASARKIIAAKAFAHWPLGQSAYKQYGANTTIGSLITVAAFIVAGFAKLNKTTITKGAKPNVDLFVGLVGPGRGVYRYHTTNHRLNDSGFTSEGLKWFASRITDKATRDYVASLVKAMQKGGTVKADGNGDLKFTRNVAA